MSKNTTAESVTSNATKSAKMRTVYLVNGKLATRGRPSKQVLSSRVAVRVPVGEDYNPDKNYETVEA